VVTSSPPVAGTDRPAGAVLEHITYANEETAYTIARVATDAPPRTCRPWWGALLGVQPR